MSSSDHKREYKLPDETAAAEGHLWDYLLEPHAADASKDLREWVLSGHGAVLIMNDNLMEVIEHKGANPTFAKWKFRNKKAAHEFGAMMAPYCTVIGLLSGY